MDSLKILFVTFIWYCWHKQKKMKLVLGPTAKTGSILGYSRDKANLFKPKLNRGCPPLTANHTSAYCVEITPGLSVHHIPPGATILGFYAMRSCHYIKRPIFWAITDQYLCYQIFLNYSKRWYLFKSTVIFFTDDNLLYASQYGLWKLHSTKLASMEKVELCAIYGCRGTAYFIFILSSRYHW